MKPCFTDTFFFLAWREELEAQLLQSIEALERGQGVDGEEVLRRLRQRIKETLPGGQFILAPCIGGEL